MNNFPTKKTNFVETSMVNVLLQENHEEQVNDDSLEDETNSFRITSPIAQKEYLRRNQLVICNGTEILSSFFFNRYTLPKKFSHTREKFSYLKNKDSRLKERGKGMPWSSGIP